MNTKRTQVIIKNDFQQQLILSTLLITLITLNFIIISASLLDDMFGAADSLFSVFNLTVAVLEVVAVVIVYFVGRKISFHIAGPVYAIERTLKNMNAGDLAQQLKLRPRDQFVEVSDTINDVIGNYRERLLAMQQTLENNDSLSAEQIAALREELRWFVTLRDDEPKDATE
jgi:methyl-accepting chemotaxis protein